MAKINTSRWIPIMRHCQGEAHTHLIVTRGGKVKAEGNGVGLWFWPIGTAITEVPVNDQSVAVTFKTRTQDFQDVSISGQVWYTVTDPKSISTRFNFSIDTATGAFNGDPLTVIQGALVSAAQEAVWSHVAANTLEGLLQSELSGLSTQISRALDELDFGIHVSRAVVTGVRPERSVEEALQAKTRERLKMEADAAGFERRAKATQQERAIQEAELANQLALAKQREDLISQEATNARAEASMNAEVTTIEAQSEAESQAIHDAQALSLKREDNALLLEFRTVTADQSLAELRERLDIYDQKQAAAKVLALTKAPEALKNLQVVTLGEGGLQAALERLAAVTG
jgi:hypothetical protein